MAKTQKKKTKKVVFVIIILVIVVLLAALLVGANYLVEFGVKSDFKVPNVMPEISVSEESFDNMIDTWGKQDEEARTWIASVGSETAEILSDDGCRLSAEVVKTDPASHRWVVAVHGYRGAHSDMYAVSLYYGRQGYNVLLPDLRGCGKSEGKFLGMGWLDRLDMLKWIDYLLAEDPAAEIVLHGISMGGATVMMTAGEPLPSNVKAVVEDCGYTSVWDIFEDELKLLFGLPSFPVLNLSSGVCKLRAGYSFTEASAMKQVEKATVPMLFIHGSEDNFVSTSMVYELYEVCTAEKELLVVDGAWHGMSSNHNPDLYFETVFRFLFHFVQ